MKLRSPYELSAAIKAERRTQAEVARAAECSRQFIQKLVSGRATTCTPRLAKLIEVYLQQPAGSLFVANDSHVDGQTSKREAAVA